MPPRDSWQGTFLVATLLCIFCSLIVSGSAVGLKDIQAKNKQVDRKKNILLAAALCDKKATANEVDTIYEEKIRETLVELATGKPVDSAEVDPKTYDARKAAKDPSLQVAVTPADALMGVRNREPYASVYEIYDGEQLEGYIFPVYGKGLWSTLYGFLALEADLATVRGITFYEHAETPGLGGEVDNESWKALWPGKMARGASGEIQIKVIKGKVVPDSPGSESTIDGLSGATITTKGVDRLVKYWLGEEGFGPYLALNSTPGPSRDDHPPADHSAAH